MSRQIRQYCSGCWGSMWTWAWSSSASSLLLGIVAVASLSAFPETNSVVGLGYLTGHFLEWLLRVEVQGSPDYIRLWCVLCQASLQKTRQLIFSSTPNWKHFLNCAIASIFVSLLKGLKIDFCLANNKCINVLTTVMIFPYVFIL